MRRVLQVPGQLALVSILALGLRYSSRAQELGGASGGVKDNLDLPFDAVGEAEEEEDAPEIVTFYGQQLEGDGLFYVVDKSGSMQDQGELAVAKRELVRNITEFSDRVQFGIVFFDSSVSKFPSSGMPADANPGMKSSAIAFVNAIPGGHGSCCQEGIAAALHMANMGTAKRKVLVYLGDGGGTCQGADEATYLKQALASAISQNYQKVQINTIGILQPGAINEDFMKRLASANGGTYHRVSH